MGLVTNWTWAAEKGARATQGKQRWHIREQGAQAGAGPGSESSLGLAKVQEECADARYTGLS